MDFQINRLIGLGPRTSYKLQIRGFTSKREGGDSNPLEVETDTAQPSPPTITVLNCTGIVVHSVQSSTPTITVLNCTGIVVHTVHPPHLPLQY